RQRTIVERCDQQAARPVEQHGPELRIDAGAHDQLVPARSDHGLHGHAFELGQAIQFGEPAADGLERVAHLPSAAQIELDAAHVALVRDGAGVQLDRHRYPSASASWTASSAEAAARASTVGMPYVARTRFDSSSV